MAMRTILCMRQGRDKPTEAYYKIFEAAISMSHLGRFNSTTHMELNKAYANGDDEDVTKRIQAMCLILSANLTDTQGSSKN